MGIWQFKPVGMWRQCDHFWELTDEAGKPLEYACLKCNSKIIWIEIRAQVEAPLVI